MTAQDVWTKDLPAYVERVRLAAHEYHTAEVAMAGRDPLYPGTWNGGTSPLRRAIRARDALLQAARELAMVENIIDNRRAGAAQKETGT